jgi:hypothetical protein
MRRLYETSLRNIVVGAGFLGAGGGGSIKEGMRIVDHILEFDDGVDLVEVREVPDSDWGAVIAGMGSPKSSLEKARTYSPERALRYLEKEAGFTSSFVIPFEIGAGNSMNPMLAAVQRRIPMIDGDPCGRAVPHVDMTTFFLGGLDISPFALTTEDGIEIMIHSRKPSDIERVGRAITAELEGVSAACCHAMDGARLKSLVIPGTTTLVEKLGATIGECRAKGADPAERIERDYDGCILGKGRVRSVTGETRGGFDFGTVEVEGEIPASILFQNENIIAWNGSVLAAVVPDLICAITREGMPLTNADVEVGMDVTYMGFRADRRFRGADIYAMFAPILEALGYDGPFVPIEDAGGRRRRA